MGSRIRVQRRGKGSLTWVSPSHRYRGEVKYPSGEFEGTVKDFIHDPGRSAPLALIESENGNMYMIAAEGMKIGDRVGMYDSDKIVIGKVMFLKDIPEGVPIYNIERYPNDGGKLVRSSGGSAEIVQKEENFVKVSLRSRKSVILNPFCRATIGVVAGGGRIEKPFVKAGKKHIVMRRRGKKHPLTSGSSMNPYDHPFGGAGKPGKPKTTGRRAPPGKKVGSIAARKTGKGK